MHTTGNRVGIEYTQLGALVDGPFFLRYLPGRYRPPGAGGSHTGPGRRCVMVAYLSTPFRIPYIRILMIGNLIIPILDDQGFHI